jgi:hypothetical protein
MIKFTQEDLIRFIYKETSEKKSADIKTALQTDWNLRESYEKLRKSKENLDTINFSPRKEIVNNILEYAARNQKRVQSV